MTFRRTGLPVLLVLTVLACSPKTHGPADPEITSPPVGYAELFATLAPDYPELSDMWASLSVGDSLEAAENLRDVLLADLPRSGATLSFSDPIASADALLSGVLTLPRHAEWELPENPDWGENPFLGDADGGANWRFQYHCFEWPLPLLYAYEQTGDDRYLERLQFLISDYFADNLGGEPPSDMTWNDMGSSFRIQNLLFIWARLMEMDAIALEDIPELLLGFREHGLRLAEQIPFHPESNHGVFHNRGLIVLGFGIPFFSDSRDWRELGLSRLDEQILDLVNEEGVYLENSVYYHYYLLKTFLSLGDLLEAYGEDWSSVIIRRLEGMYHFATHALAPRGDLPMIGDSPQVIDLSRFHDLSPELEYSITQGVSGEVPVETAVCFPASGYAFFRSGWGQARAFDLESHVAFDFGPNSDGSSTHGHCDALSYVFSSKGLEWIVDPGYYALRPGTWRDYFAGPRAHNGIAVEGETNSQALPEAGLFRSEPDFDFQSAVVTLGEGRLWKRTLVFLKPDDLLVIDNVISSEETRFQYFQQWHPDIQWVEREGGFRLEQEGVSCDIAFAFDREWEVILGQEDPLQGWYSTNYGVKMESPSMIREASGTELTFCALLHVHDGSDGIQEFELIDDARTPSLVFSIDRESGSNETVEVWTDLGWVERTEQK